MGLLDSVLKVFVGDKSKKDISDIQPLVDQIKKHESAIANLSLDELRAKSDEFREKIKADQKEIQDQIDALEKEAEAAEDIDEKEERRGSGNTKGLIQALRQSFQAYMHLRI